MAFQNPYVARLQEFSSFAFNEPDIFNFYRDGGGGWEEYFLGRMNSSPQRLIFEIGCSNASFLCDIAVANPRLAFVGMDWKYKVLYKGAKRADQEKLENISLLRGRAQDLSKIFGPAEIDELWLFFPDPWAKKGQLKHRLVREDFLADAHRSLKPGGKLYFKTDHPGYFQWVLALFGEPQPDLPEYSMSAPAERSYRNRQIAVRRLENDNLPEANARCREMFKLDFHTTDYWSGSARRPALFSETRTLFEKVFVEEGLPIYYVELLKQ